MSGADPLLGRPRRTQRVELPEIDAVTYVRALSIPEVYALQSAQEAAEGQGHAESAAIQIAAYICDENGRPRYVVEDENGRPCYAMDKARQVVSELDWILVQRIVMRANQLNSLTDDAVETARGN